MKGLTIENACFCMDFPEANTPDEYLILYASDRAKVEIKLFNDIRRCFVENHKYMINRHSLGQ